MNVMSLKKENLFCRFSFFSIKRRTTVQTRNAEKPFFGICRGVIFADVFAVIQFYTYLATVFKYDFIKFSLLIL
jgi:hypothetical protein